VAQWLGQFTGRTHETRVQDAQDALQHAVRAFHEVSALQARETKAKSVRHLAKRLLQARIRLLKARIARASEPRMTGQPSAWNDGIDQLRAQENATRVGGVHGILVEFGAEAAARPSASDSTNTRVDD
jgi:hypothetical protein